MKDKAKYWVSANTTEYDEVDRHRALETLPVGTGMAHGSEQEQVMSMEDRDGEEDRVIGSKMDGYPDFGHGMLEHFQFEEGCKSHIPPHTSFSLRDES